MKYLIVSDIHGCLPRLEKVLSFYESEGYDMLVLLGDVLNYGPRNGVPEGLDGMGIVTRLNAMADKIVAVRGNCDSEVDQMLLEFPCMADYAMLVAGNRKIFLTHGHLFSADSFPAGYDIFLSGHTHLWSLSQKDGRTVCNTGSITFPKEGKCPTFVSLDDDAVLRVRGLDGEVLQECRI